METFLSMVGCIMGTIFLSGIIGFIRHFIDLLPIQEEKESPFYISRSYEDICARQNYTGEE